MRCGLALGVDHNPLHEAVPQDAWTDFTEAYQFPFLGLDAACDSFGALFQTSFSQRHSVCNQPTCIDHFQAVDRALDLQWEVLKDTYNFYQGSFQPLFSVPAAPSSLSQRPHFAHCKKQRVHFADHIEVLMGDSFDTQQTNCTSDQGAEISHSSLV